MEFVIKSPFIPLFFRQRIYAKGQVIGHLSAIQCKGRSRRKKKRKESEIGRFNRLKEARYSLKDR